MLPNGSQVSAGSGAVSAPAARGAVHVVQPGDSLLGIAYRYDRSADAIARANGITDQHLIRIGQQLIIP